MQSSSVACPSETDSYSRLLETLPCLGPGLLPAALHRQSWHSLRGKTSNLQGVICGVRNRACLQVCGQSEGYNIVRREIIEHHKSFPRCLSIEFLCPTRVSKMLVRFLHSLFVHNYGDRVGLFFLPCLVRVHICTAAYDHSQGQNLCCMVVEGGPVP